MDDGKQNTRPPAVRFDGSAFETIVASAPIGIAVLKHRTILWVNEFLAQMVGRSADDLNGSSTRILYASDEEFHRIGALMYSGPSRAVREEEAVFRHSEGAVVPVLLRLAVSGLDGDKDVLVFTVLNVSGLKKTEQELRRRMEFEQLAAALSASFIMSGADEFDRVIANGLCELGRFTGSDRCSLYTFSYDDRGITMTTAAEWRDAGLIQPVGPARRGIRIDDELPWFAQKIKIREVVDIPDVNALPAEAAQEQREFIRDGMASVLCLPLLCGKALVGLFCFAARRQRTAWPGEDLGLLKIVGQMFTNTLLRRHAEEALHESERKHRMVVENANDAILVAQDGKVKFVNPRMTQVSGYSEGELLARPLTAFIHPDDRDMVVENHLRRIQGALPPDYAYQCRAVTKDGGVRWIELRGTISLWDGKPATVNFISDVTERKRIDDELRESRRALAALMDNLPGMAYRCRNDRDWTMEFVSNGSVELTGYAPDDLIRNKTLSYAGLIHPDDREQVWKEVQQALADKRPFRLIYRIRTAEGKEKWVWEQGSGIWDGDSGVFALEGFATDITARKKLEEEQQRSQKLESLGVLAGGIAHDFNNILTAILGNISVSRINLAAADPRNRWLEDAEKASFRAKELTQRLLTFSKGGAPIKRPVSLEHLVRESVAFALTGANVKPELVFAPHLPAVEADEGQMIQVFNNLIINACQAMPSGGVLRIKAERSGAPDDFPARAGAAFVRISVQDHGIGIPREHLTKIFDPYFTTKQKGSGLGLAVTYSVVTNHGGRIAVDSAPGKGTVFTIWLPASDRQAAELAEPASPAKGKGRVLVMDDEKIVRTVVSTILHELGYECTTAADGDEAVQLYREAKAAGRPFDAVIMDLTVPGGMGGESAIKLLRTHDPDVKAIVSSGYANDPVMARYREHGFCYFLAKPYKSHDLAKALQEVLQKPSAGITADEHP